jgi:hypothetical protein
MKAEPLPLKKSHFETWLRPFFQLIDFIFTVNTEPTIRQYSDRQGNPIWQVYDPMSDRTIYLNSETEVRIWCDRQFND